MPPACPPDHREGACLPPGPSLAGLGKAGGGSREWDFWDAL